MNRPSSPDGQQLALADEIEVRIEKIVTGGDGFGRWNGVPVFVPRSAPGDLLVGRVTERHPDYGRAEVVEVLEPGEGRRDPPCPHFSSCGGCDLQHIEDELQTRLRALSVEETLERLGGVRLQGKARIVQADPWAYRHRAQVHVGTVEGELRIGYRSRRGRQLVAVDQCPVLMPELESLVSRLPRLLPVDPPRRLDLLVGDGGELSVAPKSAGLPHRGVVIAVGDWILELDARCFFQAHRGLLKALTETVVGDWEGERGFDLFAGVGFFSLPLARRYGSVVAVEGDRVSGRYLQRNARRNRLDTVEFIHSAVESWIDRLPNRPDRVVVDPPRSGLPGKVRDVLCRRRPGRLTYVSCHPATLARDLRSMQRYFEIESVTLVDQFPQTGHMEVVVQMVS